MLIPDDELRTFALVMAAAKVLFGCVSFLVEHENEIGEPAARCQQQHN